MIDLAAMRIAGWHDDLVTLRAALAEKYDPRLARAYHEGKREKQLGRPCGCAKCIELASAPPITIVREGNP